MDPLFAAMRDITPNQLIICPTSATRRLASEAVFDALSAALEVRRGKTQAGRGHALQLV
jgi:hypothetical protein